NGGIMQLFLQQASHHTELGRVAQAAGRLDTARCHYFALIGGPHRIRKGAQKGR
ncbi:unnamed protein product, partial [marine sediment metagenome]